VVLLVDDPKSTYQLDVKVGDVIKISNGILKTSPKGHGLVGSFGPLSTFYDDLGLF
jgi:hypothetical protein